MGLGGNGAVHRLLNQPVQESVLLERQVGVQRKPLEMSPMKVFCKLYKPPLVGFWRLGVGLLKDGGFLG